MYKPTCKNSSQKLIKFKQQCYINNNNKNKGLYLI
jgi:hypothetical protein